MKISNSTDTQQAARDAAAAALAQRLRRAVQLKYLPRRQRLAGYRAAHWFTGLCPDPARHQRLERKVHYLLQFIQDAERTLHALKAVR